MSVQAPIRYPDLTSREGMTRRAWWLVGLNIVLPGAAQVLAGNRRLGRFGLGATFALIGAAVIALLLTMLWRPLALSIVANSWFLWALAVVLTFYALLWVVLTLDTLRLVRFVRVLPSRRAWVAGLAALSLVLATGGAMWAAQLTSSAGGLLSKVFVAGPSVAPINGRYNVLVLGGDAGPDRQGLRPDSTSVVSIDAATGKAVVIGIPRDLQNAPFPQTSPMHALYPNGYGANGDCDVDVCQWNSIYTEVEVNRTELYPDAVSKGSDRGIEAMRDAAEGVTGLTIQFYVLIDMAGFSQLIDALGGVDVVVEHDVPIHADETFTTVREWIKAGPQHLDGYHALWFARSRHGSSDYDRMNRQRQLQAALLEQFTPANVLTKFQAVAAAGSQVVKTDVPQSMLGYFVDLAAKTKQLPVTNVELVPGNDVDPEHPDFAYIRTLIDQALAPVTPTPTPTK
ncbi:MAG TPA: LCP family protein [Candidatus Lumbricidophila sp.]|nr:LCP family protein [Candidatus Lumbricidophila sp.]